MKYKNPVTGEVKDIYVKLLGDTLPIGVVLSYPGSSAPTNWLICDGSAVSRTTYANLFAIIGTLYGAGDGSTTFNLPNYKGRTPVGFDSTQTEFNVLGKAGGAKTHTLTVGQLPKHKPTFYGYSSLPESTPTSSSNSRSIVIDKNKEWLYSMNEIGNNEAHNNLQPYIAQNYIIKAFQSIGVVANVAQTKTNSDNDVYSCNYINNLNTYSTEEKVIGIYKGKPLYRKMIITNFITSNENWNKFNNINHNIPNVDLMFVNNDKSYIMRNGTQQLNPIMSKLIERKSDYENYAVAFNAIKTTLSYYYGVYLVQSGDSMQANITLEYTKTID